MDINYRLCYEKRTSFGALLLLNAPSQMQFGINLSNWTIGAKFMGIKLLPPGAHYITYALKDEDYQAKQGFFILIDDPNRNVIREWSEKYQRFIPLKPESDKNYQIGLDNLDFDQYLGDYPIDQHSNWKDLSSFLTKGIIDKLDPISYKYLTLDNEYDAKETALNETIYFTPLSHLAKVYSVAHTTDVHKLTNDNIDKSNLLNELLQKEYKGIESMLLGELQYAFVLFLIGEAYDGLVQWKNLLAFLMSCETAVAVYDKLYCCFIEVLYHQLRNCPKDLFSDAILANNFLRRSFEHFFFEFDSTTKAFNALRKRVELFNKFLMEHFDYNAQSQEKITIERYLNQEYVPSMDDIDDELPVIVSQEEIDESLHRVQSQMEID